MGRRAKEKDQKIEKKESTSKQLTHEMKHERDELVDSLAGILNKDFKDLGKIAFNLEEDDDPATVTDWISTGSSLLDLIISNRKHGGFPAGRVSELTGLEASGKSLIAAHALADTQRKGGVAVYIDTESAISKEFLQAIGVDVSKMMYVPLETTEDIFSAMETIICNVRKQNKDRLVTIVVDSLAGATTKDEAETGYELTGFNTKKAIIISKAFRKITSLIAKQRICVIITNQLREKVGVMVVGDINKYTTSGGKALGFYASVRVRLKPTGQIKNSSKDTIGMSTKATVYKNRMGPPHRSVEFNLFFDRGISDYDSWIEVMLEKGILKNAKPKDKEEVKKKKNKDEKEEKVKCFAFTMTTGENVTFERKTFHNLITTRPEVREELYDKLCEALIMKYKDATLTLQEDVEVSEGAIDE
jgi:recombination protein RecA